MFHLRKIYERLFSSFRIEGGELLIRTLRSENVTGWMIIKRSWIYGCFASLMLIPILAVSWAHAYVVLTRPPSDGAAWYAITGIIVATAAFIAFSGILFLRRFYVSRKNGNAVFDIREAEGIMRSEALEFAGFFNRVSLGYFVFVILALWEIARITWVEDTGASAWNYAVSLLIEIFLISHYRLRMIDLEMDYVVVVPGRFYFVDQTGVRLNEQTLRLVTGILVVRWGYPNLVGSLLDYGTIEISEKFDKEILVSDTPNILEKFHLHYVQRPIETANAMNALLWPDHPEHRS